MDRTLEFLHTAKKLGYLEENTTLGNQRKSPLDEFTALALEIRRKMDTTKDYLSSKRRKYLMFSMGSLVMSDKERDAFEAFVSNNLKECFTLLMQLKNLVGTETHQLVDAKEYSLRAYRLGVISSLMEQLRSVEEDFSTLRVERVVNVSTSGDSKLYKEGTTSNVNNNSNMMQSSNGDSWQSDSWEDGTKRRSQDRKQLLLEGENETLLVELMETLEQVKTVEKQAVEIAALNQVLSTKLSEQAEEIESLYHDALYSLENVQKGNKELKRWSKRSSSWNFYWIFCILVATFSLLFLHWIS
ncbi:hypothetical protein GAYE_SCF01G1940 [Galdieria yellowstonensis]|uniref:Syntaxin 18 n=1 Tax=Galdieria yellowstonensis TaxID=3028027 RepID=A0AAV9I9R0_9RHOD|nr:hypothetical protein GAYE_SCF01G1940 [Galdieria yellowstonensis]